MSACACRSPLGCAKTGCVPSRFPNCWPTRTSPAMSMGPPAGLDPVARAGGAGDALQVHVSVAGGDADLSCGISDGDGAVARIDGDLAVDLREIDVAMP